jgi:hypothetical protein
MIYQFQDWKRSLTKSETDKISQQHFQQQHQEIENSHNNLTLTTATATAQ